MSATTSPIRNLAVLTLTCVTIAAAGCAGGGHYYAEKAGADYASYAPDPAPNAEDYTDYGVNGFVDPKQDNLSTFAIDVDTGSYTISRRKLEEGALPPKDAVRVEEFVNYFKYDYPQPDGQVPFAVDFDAAPSPFDADRVFLRIGVQGKVVAQAERPPIHLTFLVDTSGSMQSADKIGLLVQSLHTLVRNLDRGDTVALATYAGSTSEVLAPTDVRDADKIHAAIGQLSAGGSTAMESGLQLAYKMAYKNFQPGHINRVIVCSDGDANVGSTDHGGILESISHYTKEGVTLSTIGFGMGNYKDTMMEQLANKGNGNYYYIDNMKQAKRVFQDDLMGTLVVIAKDVKIQVEFDPALVRSYRLVGYENRDVADEDFRDDAVDGGEIGSGHSVTALYEVALVEGALPPRAVPATVRIRHMQPDGGKAVETTYAFGAEHLHATFAEASRDYRMAFAVAAFAEKLRQSPHAETWTLADIRQVAVKAARDREDELELVTLIERAIALSGEGLQSRR